ncbi:MAG: right-handed parallel beta-helix repeat-containing protein, partial [Actinomycetota bacterium]|nr:right-handed parallel beta-helix repeat-containing protein [Actinomycetota bacterium]
MLSGTVTIEGLVLTKGFVPDGWVVGGAGLSIRQGSVATVTDCEITLNAARNGGGVDMPEAAEATFTDCDIHDNVARTVSAGIGMQRRNKATFTNCNIYNNRALAGSSGGGTLAGEVRMENCRIYDNTASMNGGGLTINGNDRTDPIRSDRVELVNNIIEGNSAGGHGGGLDLRSTGPVSTTGGQIRGNSANSGGRNIFVTGTPSQVCLAMSGTTVDGGTERSDGTSAIECLASFVSVERAQGATSNMITVSPGAGTLAEAVGKAQDGDTLILQDGTYTSAGDRRRVLENLGKRLTIKAFNRRKAILDGQDRDRVAMLSGTVTIEGLVLTKGFVPDGWVVGGAGLSIRQG